MNEEAMKRLQDAWQRAWGAGGKDLQSFDEVYVPDALIHHHPFQDIVGLKNLKIDV